MMVDRRMRTANTTLASAFLALREARFLGTRGTPNSPLSAAQTAGPRRGAEKSSTPKAAFSSTPKAASRGFRRGFTLLEVMVATAILGLGLTAILSAQAGAFSTAAHARNLSVATTLARCKMGEIEEHLFVDGVQELEENESGPCCEGDETPNLKCAWKIEKPQFPEPKLGELDLDTSLDLSSPGGAKGAAAGGNLGPLGAMMGMGAPPGSDSSGGVPPALGDSSAGGLGDLASTMGGAGAMDALGGMLQMVGTFVYPQLKTIFENNARRITLTVTWTEGSKDYSFDVVQWYVNPQPSLPTNELLDAQSSGLPGSSSGGSSGNTSSGKSSSGKP